MLSELFRAGELDQDAAKIEEEEFRLGAQGFGSTSLQTVMDLSLGFGLIPNPQSLVPSLQSVARQRKV